MNLIVLIKEVPDMRRVQFDSERKVINRSSAEADLTIILSEKSKDALCAACRMVNQICDKHGVLEAFMACTREEQAEVLAIRSNSYEVIKDTIYHSLDMAVPPASMPGFLQGLLDLCNEYQAKTNFVSHIADGNVHNDILLENTRPPAYHKVLRDLMYQLCFSLGGTITGEHGIGKLRVEDLKQQKSPTELLIMQKIKAAFDPAGILNPGTVLEAQGGFNHETPVFIKAVLEESKHRHGPIGRLSQEL